MSDKIVNDLLRELGERLVFTIHPESPVKEAAQLMEEHKVGALVVVNGVDEVVGIVSERDIAIKIVAHNMNPSTTNVGDIMTSEVVTASRTTNLKECEVRMEEYHIRHLPVTDHGDLIAVVSIRDLLVSTRSELENLVDHLKKLMGFGSPG